MTLRQRTWQKVSIVPLLQRGRGRGERGRKEGKGRERERERGEGEREGRGRGGGRERGGGKEGVSLRLPLSVRETAVSYTHLLDLQASDTATFMRSFLASTNFNASSAQNFKPNPSRCFTRSTFLSKVISGIWGSGASATSNLVVYTAQNIAFWFATTRNKYWDTIDYKSNQSVNYVRPTNRAVLLVQI